MRASSVLPTPVGPRNRNDPIGTVRVGETGTRPPDRVRDRADGFVLADDPPVEDLLHADELGHLALHEPAHGDAGPLRDDLGDVLLVDLFLEHLHVGLELVEPHGAPLDLLLELAHRAVAQLRGLLEVALALGALGVVARGLELLLEGADLGDRVLLVLPVRDLRVALLGELGELGLDGRRAGPSTRRRSPWRARPSRSRAGGSAARSRRSRTASSRSRCAGATRPRRSGRWPCRGADAR